MRRTAAVSVLVVGTLLAGGGRALAQSYPSHPVRIIVPWPPGQATDIVARMVAERLSPALGQPMVLDNRPGAGGVIGTEIAAKAAADGYTILAGSSGPISIGPSVQKVPYDPLKDFAPVSTMALNPTVLVVNPAIPAHSVKELIALLRANPNKYSFSTSGAGSTSHLFIARFNAMAGVEAVHVPYKGSSPSVSDVVAGLIAYTMETGPAVGSYLSAGRLRALGISTMKRSPSMPDLPTIDEAGLPGYDMFAWIGLLAPAGTAGEVVERLSAETRKVLQDPDLQKRLTLIGLEPLAQSPREFAEFLSKQNDRFSAIAKEAHIRID